MKFPFNHVDLTKEEKVHYKSLLLTGNTPVRTAYKKMIGNEPSRKKRLFRSQFHYRKCLLDRLGTGIKSIDFCGFTFTECDVEAIKMVEDAKFRIASGYVNLASKIINRLYKSDFVTENAFPKEDAVSESVIAMMKAVTSFDRSDIEVSTYVGTLVRTELFKKVKHTVYGRKGVLVERYYKAKFENPHLSFDELVCNMELSDKSIAILIQRLKTVCTESDLCPQAVSGEEHPTIDIVSQEFRNIKGEITSGNFINDEGVEIDVRVAIQNADLNSLQLAVIQGVMSSTSNGYHNGTCSIGTTMINPNTNKPYTRAACTQAMMAAKKKILKSCQFIR